MTRWLISAVILSAAGYRIRDAIMLFGRPGRNEEQRPVADPLLPGWARVTLSSAPVLAALSRAVHAEGASAESFTTARGIRSAVCPGLIGTMAVRKRRCRYAGPRDAAERGNDKTGA